MESFLIWISHVTFKYFQNERLQNNEKPNIHKLNELQESGFV